MIFKIIICVVCFSIGIFMCYMPSIEQRNEEKRKKQQAELDNELYRIIKNRKMEKDKNEKRA